MNDDDLPANELESVEYHACSSGTPTPPKVRDAILAMVREIRRRRELDAKNAVFSGDPPEPFRPSLISTIPSIDGHPCGLEIRSFDSGLFSDTIAVIVRSRAPNNDIHCRGVVISKLSADALIDSLKLHGQPRDQ